ncbi:MAG: hypothetical protein RL326_441 [Pseudomonadota bacterium]|jgi:hypothetical protein
MIASRGALRYARLRVRMDSLEMVVARNCPRGDRTALVFGFSAGAMSAFCGVTALRVVAIGAFFGISTCV